MTTIAPSAGSLVLGLVAGYILTEVSWGYRHRALIHTITWRSVRVGYARGIDHARSGVVDIDSYLEGLYASPSDSHGV